MSCTRSVTKKLAIVLVPALLLGAGCEKKDEQPDKEKQAQEKKQEKTEEKGIEEMSGDELVAAARGKLGSFGVAPEEFPTDENELNAAKVKLGRMLYYDPRFSADNETSCNTCHGLKEYGVDHEPTSIGHNEKEGPRNAPTVYYAAGHVAQFWDGREPDVEAQAKGPVLNPIEMGMPSAEKVNAKLKKIVEYEPLFKEAFPEADTPVSFDNMARAIGAFERKLVTKNSPWDQFQEGDDEAMSEKQLKGFLTFMDTGCQTCHMGELVGGNMYQKLGLVEEYPDKSDLGRYEVTEKEADKMKFKVPSLRNVTETEPYFHDGSIESLEKAVELMGTHQLGQDLSDKEVELIMAYLESLTGEIPTDYVAKPDLPGLEEGG